MFYLASQLCLLKSASPSVLLPPQAPLDCAITQKLFHSNSLAELQDSPPLFSISQDYYPLLPQDQNLENLSLNLVLFVSGRRVNSILITPCELKEILLCLVPRWSRKTLRLYWRSASEKNSEHFGYWVACIFNFFSL
jgi:hypothetical protein